MHSPSRAQSKFHVTSRPTLQAHSSYVDTVRFFGHLVCSKSSECRIELWRQYFENDGLERDDVPIDREMPRSIATLHYVDKEAVWFYKMSFSQHMTHVAVGTYEGYVYLWDLRVGLFAAADRKTWRTVFQPTGLSFASTTGGRPPCFGKARPAQAQDVDLRQLVELDAQCGAVTRR